MLHFSLESRHVGRESKFSHFSSSWTKFSCFFLFCVSANAAASRPELSVFPRAFRARGCGGERVTLLFGRARLCGPADVDTTMSVWLLDRSVHSEKCTFCLCPLFSTTCYVCGKVDCFQQLFSSNRRFHANARATALNIVMNFADSKAALEATPCSFILALKGFFAARHTPLSRLTRRTRSRLESSTKPVRDSHTCDNTPSAHGFMCIDKVWCHFQHDNASSPPVGGAWRRHRVR
jgi:hypothetical protein